MARCIRTRKPLYNELSNIIQLFECHVTNVSGTGVIVYVEVGLLPSHSVVQIINLASSFRSIKENEILQTDSKSVANWIWTKSYVHCHPKHAISSAYLTFMLWKLLFATAREYWKIGPKLCCGYSNVKYCSKISNELNIFEFTIVCIYHVSKSVASPTIF